MSVWVCVYVCVCVCVCVCVSECEWPWGSWLEGSSSRPMGRLHTSLHGQHTCFDISIIKDDNREILSHYWTEKIGHITRFLLDHYYVLPMYTEQVNNFVRFNIVRQNQLYNYSILNVFHFINMRSKHLIVWFYFLYNLLLKTWKDCLGHKHCTITTPDA